MNGKLYLDDLGIICSLGSGKDAVWKAVSEGRERGIRKETVADRDIYLALVDGSVYTDPIQPPFNTRVNSILRRALDEIRISAMRAIETYGAERVALLVGSCDNGSELSNDALAAYKKEGAFPDGYRLERQRADLPARFAAEYLGTKGPDIAYSTACSSSASALVSARNLIQSGICDAAIAGGVDIVSRAVALGFSSLEAVSNEPCQPFSRNRKGITLGEGAALFVVTRDDLGKCGISLLGAGESADAHHMTAPDPAGTGATLSMERALADAGIGSEDVDYVSLHGTGTALNDAMESRALTRVFPNTVPASSTKSMTGHTLGAAGALELGICWLAISDRNPDRILPPQIWDGEKDEDLPEIDIVEAGRKANRLSVCLSNSFAFGGCNVSLVVGRTENRATAK